MSAALKDQPADISQQAIDKTAPVTKTDRDAQKAVKEYSQAGGNQPSMKVKVHSPFHNYYEGPVFSISAENATGPFDILPRHHNFISLLMPCDLVIRSVSSGEQRIRISGGIMHVKADEVIVFLDV